MRRSEKEITEQALIANVLAEADLISLAFCPGPGESAPYVVFVHPLYYDGALYIHSATSGRKIDLIRHNPHVAFTAAVDVRIVRNKFNTRFRSVCGTALAEVVSDHELRVELLDRLSERYQAACPKPIPPKQLERIAVIRLSPVTLSGKQSLPEADDN